MTRPRLIDHAADNLGRTMPPRLSIDSNRFTLIDSGGNQKPINALNLDVCFVDLNQKVSKMFWGKEYSTQDAGGDIPVCWSDNGMAPSSQAATPQNPTCMACPHNAIGSAISKFSGAKIKACVDMKKLAFIVPGDPDNMIFLMTVKPGSFKNWQTYINFLKAQKFTDGSSPDLSDVVTRLEFESQGVLKFSPVAPVPGNQALLAQREAAWNKNTSGDIVGQNDVPYSGQLAAPTAQPALAAPVPFVAAPQMAAPAASNTAFAPADASQSQPSGTPPKSRRGRKLGATAENGFQAPAAPFAQGAPTQPAPFMAQPSPSPAPQQALSPAQVAPQPPQGPATDTLDIPPFLQRQQPTTPQPTAPPAQPQAGFGMATPAQPDAAMQDAIAKAFALTT